MSTAINKMAFNMNRWVGGLLQVFQYPFMQHAFEAGTVIAIVAGIVGYFVVLRRSSFAAHALSHIGFSGAAGAVLLGISPVYGLLLFTCVGGIGIAVLGRRAAQRDIQIGTILAFMLGIGVLFISLYTGYATEVYSILFGEINGIVWSNVLLTIVSGSIILVLVAAVYRPLLFASLDEDVAEAKGMHVLLLGIIFMLLLAVATSIAVQVVGVLLIFSLMVTPAATAQQLSKRPQHVIIISVAIALIATWLGLFIQVYLQYPVGFFITSIVFIFYLLVKVFASREILKSFIYRRIRPQKLLRLILRK
jgi:zinc/manganese transport system permease protein